MNQNQPSLFRSAPLPDPCISTSITSKVRAISHPSPVTILFYCLDPQYPGLPHVAALDVEGFLTNSESTRRYLLPSAPTALVPLAVDTEEAFPFYPDPTCPGAASSEAPKTPNLSEEGSAAIGHGEGGDYGGCRVVYVGAAALLEYKEKLAGMLREAAPYGLDIYGSGWQKSSEFSGYWRGVLPQEDLVSSLGILYSNSGAVEARLFPRARFDLAGLSVDVVTYRHGV